MNALTLLARMPSVPLISIFIWIGIQAATFALTIDADSETLIVEANNNDLKHLQPECEYVVSQVVPDLKDVTVSIDGPPSGYFHFTISSEKLQPEQAKRVREALYNYLSLRAEGHSQEYALYLVLHGTDKWPSYAEQFVERDPAFKETIAFPWIHFDVHGSLAFLNSRESENSAIIYVIDGDLAWIYGIPRKGGDPKYKSLVWWRMDAVEFSPSASKIIHSVFNEMKSAGQTPTEKNQIGSIWWLEFQKKLKKKAGIHWRTPIELNPETIFE